ncbi:hypothetical protein Fmac_004123 [Flemingia macrophylla]|uniref:Uncharacterized protein n=1 Tax=Flemingia macrophylla TaxID=520843 RepID=A0ABD1N417_9FABA
MASLSPSPPPPQSTQPWPTYPPCTHNACPPEQPRKHFPSHQKPSGPHQPNPRGYTPPTPPTRSPHQASPPPPPFLRNTPTPLHPPREWQIQQAWHSRRRAFIRARLKHVARSLDTPTFGVQVNQPGRQKRIDFYPVSCNVIMNDATLSQLP